MTNTPDARPVRDDAATRESPRIAVCIATLHRTDGLRRALESVAAQDFTALDGAAPRLRAFVANNDPADRAPHAVAAEVRAQAGLEVDVVDVAERGTAPPRNALLSAARGQCEMVAFLDDDEEAPPRWLASLLRTKHATRADIVTGGVVPRFERTPPRWATELRLFERPRRPTGSPRPWAFTGNVLFDASLLESLDRWFDRRFTQGEDRHFFARLAATGARIVWCDEDPPVEFVPAARVDPRWIARRMRAIGRAVTAIERDTPARRFAAPRNLAKGLVWLGVGSAQWTAGIALGEVQRVAGRRLVAYGLGLVEGALGVGAAGAGTSGAGDEAVDPSSMGGGSRPRS
jgi:glycosyltransferase involved in cell wall biosynthesis